MASVGQHRGRPQVTMQRTTPEEDEVATARRWLRLAKLVATTLAALAAVARTLGWV